MVPGDQRCQGGSRKLCAKFSEQSNFCGKRPASGELFYGSLWPRVKNRRMWDLSAVCGACQETTTTSCILDAKRGTWGSFPRNWLWRTPQVFMASGGALLWPGPLCARSLRLSGAGRGNNRGGVKSRPVRLCKSGCDCGSCGERAAPGQTRGKAYSRMPMTAIMRPVNPRSARCEK
jgi:hypothetical protein